MGAPIVFAVFSAVNFRRFSYTPHLSTAAGFTAFVILMDSTVVAFVILRSFAMFESILGTWIPFALIFFSTFFMGQYSNRSQS